MAELTVKEGGETVITLPTPPPSIVKVSEVDQRADAIRKQRELPKKPGPNVTFKEMVDWLKLLNTEEMLSRIVIYVYRLDPPIIRQKVDPEADNNIDILIDGFHELTEEKIIDSHGGGTYRFIVRDDDASKKSSEGYFQSKLSVPITIHPPKLDLREVDWDHKNCKGFRSWARAKRLIDDNNMPIIESKQNPSQNGQSNNNNSDTTAVVKMMMDFVAKMNADQQQQFKKNIGEENSVGKGVQELLLEKMKQDDPNKQITTVTALMAAMKSNEPKQQPDTMVTVLPLFMQMMQAQQSASDKQFQMMMELLKDSKKSSGEETNEVDKLRALIELSKEMKGGSTGTKSTAEVVSEIVGNNLTPVLNIVATILAARSGQPNGQTPMPQQPKQPQNNVEIINARNAAQTVQPNAGGLPSGEPPVTTNEAAQIIQQFGPLIYRNLGSEGWEFAEIVGRMFGDDVTATIIKHGVDGMVEAAKSVPAFWNQVNGTYGEPYLRKWLDSFMNYKEIMRKMEEEDGEEEEETK